MKKKGTVFRCLVLMLVVFATVSSCWISAAAIAFSGGSFSSSSGGSALNNTSFSVRSANAQYLVVGYRFAGITADGELADEKIHSIDIILSSKYAYINGGTDVVKHSRLQPQWSQKQKEVSRLLQQMAH